MADFNFENLTEEQKAAIQEFLYKKYSEQPSSDESQFVIPFIAMNDGHTPAQVKAIAKGLYKDIQRSPFLRKTGTFTEDGRIEDIDITPLVYYGTLQQAKIAPTLENIDVKLYFREPALHKVPSNDPSNGEFADSYVWRELPVGFHVYNNDTVYGYEWLVLQDNYVGTNGIYNLHMNIEDGIGVCKFAGTQAPINLAGVQYKIVITAKNLWNREFSLLDSMPLLHSLTASSDELAPTVNAIKEYYAKAVETLKVVTKELYVADAEEPVLYANEDGVTINNLTLGNIENLEAFVTALSEDLDGHRNAAIDGADYDEDGKLLSPHGIKNTGFTGNIAAHSLDGLTLSNGYQALVDNVVGRYAYIPFVANDNSIGLGTTINYYTRGAGVDPTLMYRRTFEALPRTNTLNIVDISGQDELSNVLYSLAIGTNIFNASLEKADEILTVKLTAGNAKRDPVKLDVNTVATSKVELGDDTIVDKAWVDYISGSSSIAYKIPISELLAIKVKDSLGADLVPNRETDADGYPVTTWDTSDFEDHDLELAAKAFTEDGFNTAEGATGLDKLGSALQALYELPLSTYEYKRGQQSYKEQIGIFVERVNQFRDKLAELRGTGEGANGVPAADNYLVHKRATCLQSNNEKIVDYDKGLSIADNSLDQGTDFTARVANNEYTYTEEEIKSIAHYLDLMTSKQELQHEIRNTVGILLKAAKETQERLIDVETAVYGFDAETIPGSDASRKAFVDGHIATELQTVLNSSPLLLGLNRLMRAVCLELYNTTDLESIDAEIRSVVGDSDTLKEKVTVKSRMDKVDDILSALITQSSAITKYYTENVFNDESAHTYTDVYDIAGTKQTITDDATITEDEHILDNLADDHTETKDADKDRLWRNLPAAEDVTDEAKDAVTFANIADSTHKHTPKAEESGSVRVPETVEFEHTDIDKDGNPTVRTWKGLAIEKDEETGTYHPVFKTKAVAWDHDKLERINKKLSEVTKDVYGTDDVTASLPNRTEVLRRNITNLVDDLYPNRSFAVEKPHDVGDEESDIRLPFKTSKVQVPEEASVASMQTDEPDDTETHTSIIPWIDNELFNFSIANNFVRTFDDATTREVFNNRLFNLYDDPKGYLKNKQISLRSVGNGIVDGLNFDSSKLVTDPTVFDPANYGTYKKAYSRLDMLENLIGVKDCYITDLLQPTTAEAKSAILDSLGIDSLNATILDAEAQKQDLVQVRAHLVTLRDTLTARIGVVSNQITTIDRELQDGANEVARCESEYNQAVASMNSREQELHTAEAAVVEAQNAVTSAQATLDAASAATAAAWEAYQEAIRNRNNADMAWRDAGRLLENQSQDNYTYQNFYENARSLASRLQTTATQCIRNGFTGLGKIPSAAEELGEGYDENSVFNAIVDSSSDLYFAISNSAVSGYLYSTGGTLYYSPTNALIDKINAEATEFIAIRQAAFDAAIENHNTRLQRDYDEALEEYTTYQNWKNEYASIPNKDREAWLAEHPMPTVREVPPTLPTFANTVDDLDPAEKSALPDPESLVKVFDEDTSVSVYNLENAYLPILAWNRIVEGLVDDVNEYENLYNEASTTQRVAINSDLQKHRNYEDETGTAYRNAVDIEQQKQTDWNSCSYAENQANQARVDAVGFLDNKRTAVDTARTRYETATVNVATCNSNLNVATNAQASRQATKTSLEETKQHFENYRTATVARLNELDTNLNGIFDLLPSYTAELSFQDLRYAIGLIEDDEKDEAAAELLASSNLGFVLSRKQKTIQERVTTLEAFADEISKGLGIIDRCRLLEEQTLRDLRDSGDFISNLRFESQNAIDTLHHLAELNSDQNEEHLIFDLDLSESFKTETVDTRAHNADIWKIVRCSKEVSKSAYDERAAKYTITGRLAIDPNYLNFAEANTQIQNSYEQWATTAYTITVKYISSPNEIAATTSADYYKTIYLFRKTPTTKLYRLFNNADNSTAHIDEVLVGGKGWQNQTEYNIYKTMSDMFTSLFTKNLDDVNSLYYKMMKLAHPTGSMCMTLENPLTGDPRSNPLSGGRYYYPDSESIFGTSGNINNANSLIISAASSASRPDRLIPGNPAAEFGGLWLLVGRTYMPKTSAVSVSTKSVLDSFTIQGTSMSASYDYSYASGYSYNVSPNPHSHDAAINKTGVVSGVSDARLEPMYIWVRVDGSTYNIGNGTNNATNADSSANSSGTSSGATGGSSSSSGGYSSSSDGFAWHSDDVQNSSSSSGDKTGHVNLIP